MRTQQPRWSVIIPSYNRKACVLDAVHSALQNHAVEVIVVDDGSTDGTEQLFSVPMDPRVQYHKLRRNSGVNVARNYGVNVARGDYCVFLDSDDVLVKNAFRILDEIASKGKLREVNLFGTAERGSGKPMYYLAGERDYSYSEWLGGEVIGGEFLAVVKRKVFRSIRFPEERFCFEGFFWNTVIRKRKGLFASPTVLRHYSYAQQNRVSPQLLSPSLAHQRYKDYKQYLKEFGPDYERLQHSKAHSAVLCSAAFYAILDDKTREARAHIREARQQRWSPRCVFLFGLSLMGSRATRWFVNIYRYL